MSDKQYEDKPNTGVMFQNTYKKGENHPDLKGHIVDSNGKKWDISAWESKSKNGKHYFSLRISEPFVKKDKQDNYSASKDKPQKAGPIVDAPDYDYDDDDLPF